jgi:hypothetical protein
MSLIPSPMADALPSACFAEHALPFHDAGLCPIPCGGADGKVPLVRWRGTKARHRRATISVWILKPEFAFAGIGILTGQMSGLTVVDCDDPELLDRVLATCGPTPIIVSTPSGGYHAWYQHAGEGSLNLRDYGLAIDVKADGGFVVAPPTIRHAGPHAGKAYRFWLGSLADLACLPKIKPGGFDALCDTGSAPGRSRGAKLLRPASAVAAGQRNNTGFRQALRLAASAASSEELACELQDWNIGNCAPPLPEAEVSKTAASAWKYHKDGRNWVGCGGVSFSAAAFDRIGCPHAIWLLGKLHLAHAAHGGEFAIAARAMANSAAFPMGEYRIREATKRLVTTGDLVQTHQGGRKQGDASRYRLGRAPASA